MFSVFAPHIDYYPKFIHLSQNKKSTVYTPTKLHFLYIKCGFPGISLQKFVKIFNYIKQFCDRYCEIKMSLDSCSKSHHTFIIWQDKLVHVSKRGSCLKSWLGVPPLLWLWVVYTAINLYMHTHWPFWQDCSRRVQWFQARKCTCWIIFTQ